MGQRLNINNSSEGCTNKIVKGGVCVRHGAKVKRCSSEGCKNQAQKGGVCMRHGAKVKRCRVEGCTNLIQRRGVCRKHEANHNSTSFIGSDFDKTTLIRSNQCSLSSASASQDILCGTV